MGRKRSIASAAVDDADRAASVERYRALCGLTSDFAYLIRLEGDGRERLEWLTGAFEAITGYTPRELAARGGWMTLLHPDDAATVAAHQQCVLAGEEHMCEVRIVPRQGGERWLRCHDRPERAGDGRVVGVLGAARDITDRKRLEAALRASEIQFRTLADTTSAAILLYDEDDRVLYANPATATITGYSVDELRQRTLWDLIHPDFHAAIRERRRARTAGEEPPSRATMTIRTRDGATRWVDYSAGFAEIAGRQIAIGTAFDVTGHKRAEAAIRAERDFSEAILKSLPGVFYLYDEHLHFMRWNENFERVLGYSGAEIDALSPLDLFVGDDRRLLAERIGEVFATGASDVEAEFVTRDGRRIPYYFTGQTTRVDDRLCLIGTGIDITQRKVAEAALRETQRRLEDAQARARLGSWEIDPRSRQSFWSAEMYRLYGRDVALGPPSFDEFFALTHPEDHQRLREGYRRCVETGEPLTLDFRAVRTDGSVAWLSGTVDCGRDADGQVVRLAGTVLDITARTLAEQEQRRLEAALRRSEVMAAMGALVGGVAHEVRNPIFGMTATLDALQARFGERAELGPYLGVLRGELDRLGELMRDLLEYGKPYTPALAAAPIAGAVRPALAACRALADEAGVTLIADDVAGDAIVRFDSGRLRQVFDNLLRNAIQVSPRGAAVELILRPLAGDGAGWLECTVADRGPGFAADDLLRIFEPFFTRRRGGTGLGLPIVQRIVEEHGGTVAATNRAGGGATLTVRLPLEGRCSA